jgi:xylulokinase
MAKEYLIGVDLGTSVVKSTLFDLEGRALADATRETDLHQPSPGVAEQNADDFVVATLDCIQRVVDQAGAGSAGVAAIAFDGQMGGAMGVDQNFLPVTPWYVSSLDVRYQPYLKKMVDIAGGRLLELAGAMPIAGPRMLWWKHEYPDLYKRVHKVLILANYVAGRLAGLTGEDAFVDPSYLQWIGLSDTANHAWSPELLEMFDLPLGKLPRIVPATTIVGGLSAEASEACGLVSGTPLVAGAGDQVASCLGAGLVQSGQLIDVAGTFSVLATCLDRYLADTRHEMLQPLASPIPGLWYPMMYISGGGLTHRWFRDEFGRPEVALAEGQGGSAYALLDAQAAELPAGSEGLLFIPHLGGRTCPNLPNVRGAWLGFTWTHRGPHFYRALLEAIAYDYAEALAVVREYYPDVNFQEVRVIGGGAGSDLWNQIKADVLGLPYLRLQREDVAAVGCAIMAGHAVGVFPDMASAASRFAQTAGRVEPSPEQHDRYQPYAAAYREAYDQLGGVYANLAGLRGE